MNRYIRQIGESIRKGDLILLLLCLMTTAFGCLIISSATSHMETIRLVVVQIFAAAIGVVFFAITASIDAEYFSEQDLSELLNADAVALAGNGEVSGHVLPAVVDRENLALEILKTGLLAFPHADGDANDVTSLELGEVLLRELRRLFGVDLVQNLDTHFKPSFLR